MRYRLSEQAAEDVEYILLKGLLEFGQFQAMTYQNSLKRTFEMLVVMPKIGRASERGHDNELRFLHGSHVIYYRIEPDEIIIEAIEHGRTVRNPWGD